jgi:hypothetical protein
MRCPLYPPLAFPAAMEKMMTQADYALRWRRGLVRLWVVLSLIWIGWIGPANWSLLTGHWVLDRTHERILGPNFQAVREIFGPPLVVFLIGFALVWVIRGFHRPTNPTANR